MKPDDMILFQSNSEMFSEFSNFAPFPIVLDGREWATVENYYQAAKFERSALRREIAEAGGPGLAKRLARRNRDSVRPDWDEVKLAIMTKAVTAKFTQHPDLGELLVSTGDRVLAENSRSDRFWGLARDRTGQNEMGKLLMRLREELAGRGSDAHRHGT